jgi:hypothetical protein
VKSIRESPPTHIIGSPDSRIGQLSPVGLPRSDIPLGSHLQVDRVDHDAVPRPRIRRPALAGIEVGRIVLGPVPASKQLLVVGRVVLLVEPGGETKVGQLDVTLPVDQDVVGFDVTASVTISLDQPDCSRMTALCNQRTDG